jgi:endonuclease/exonuclease/phosphatase family metal-dependent hydrolase
MKSTRLLIMSIALLGTLTGCDDDPEPAAAQLNVATYNGGLAYGFVNNAPERRQPIFDALAAEQLDVLCVQEFWEADDRDALRAAVTDSMAHSYGIDAFPGVCGGDGVASCTQAETEPLEACAIANCGEEPDANLVNCVIAECGDELAAVQDGCTACMATQAGASLETIIAACGPEAGPHACYAYDGSVGTDILSRYPMGTTSHMVFDSTLNRRAVLHAELTDTPMGTVHVFCTHLTANLGGVDYPGGLCAADPTTVCDAGSYEAEQLVQINQLRAFIDEKAGDAPVVLLGDFNTGPGVGDKASAELEANYDVLTGGFDTTYATSTDADCTFCGDNPLVSGADRDHSVLLDHVLLRGFDDKTKTSTRILDGRISLEGIDGESAYSDHYGLKVVIK